MIVLVGRGEVAVEQIVELDADEAHHLRVRRAEPGDPVGLRDGAGLIGAGILLEAAAKRALVRVTAVDRVPPPPGLDLFVGAGDRDRFGWLAEKCAELGVTALSPVETERTAGVASRMTAGHTAKLQRRAREAVKQSGSPWASLIGQPLQLAEIPAPAPGTASWLADAEGAWPPALEAAQGVRLLVGPEGGLAIAERSHLIAAGWLPVRLGKHVLRFETAALAGAIAAGIARGRGAHG